MRIAFIGDRLGLATGGNLYIARLAEELQRLGEDVTLITLTPPPGCPLGGGSAHPEQGSPFQFWKKTWAGRMEGLFSVPVCRPGRIEKAHP